MASSSTKKIDDVTTTETAAVADTEPPPPAPTRDEKLEKLLAVCEKRAMGPSLDELREAMAK